MYLAIGTNVVTAPSGTPNPDSISGVGSTALIIRDTGSSLIYDSVPKTLAGRGAFTTWSGLYDYAGSVIFNIGAAAVINPHYNSNIGRFNRITANPITGLITMSNPMTTSTPIPGAQTQYNPISNFYKVEIRNAIPFTGTVTGSYLGRRFYGYPNAGTFGVAVRFEGTTSSGGSIAWECNIGPLAEDPQNSTASRYTSAATTITTAYEVNGLSYRSGTAIAGGPGGSGRIQIYYNAQSGVAPATGLITGANTVTTVPSATAGATTYYHNYNTSTTVNGAVSTLNVTAQR
jgi:hypothetical protein